MDEAALRHLSSCAPKEELLIPGRTQGLEQPPLSPGWATSQCPVAGCSGWSPPTPPQGLRGRNSFLTETRRRHYYRRPTTCFLFDSRRAGVLIERVECIRLRVSSCGCEKSLCRNTVLYSELHVATSISNNSLSI